MNPVSLLTDLKEFVHDHRPHGSLTADATEPAWNGYLLTVACRSAPADALSTGSVGARTEGPCTPQTSASASAPFRRSRPVRR